MRRLGAIGAVFFVTGAGWMFSHRVQATQTPGSNVETKAAQPGKKSAIQQLPPAISQVRKMSAEKPQTCTAYDAPDPASDDDNRGEAYEVIKKFEGDIPADLMYVIA